MECPICISIYNNSTRRSITCLKCMFKTCLQCAKQYILESHFDAHCMNCRKDWDRMFLHDNFPKTFIINEYKKHRSDVLFEREKSLFPETLNEIARDKEIEKKEDYILYLQSKLRDENQKLNQMKNKSIKKEKIDFIRPCTKEACKGYIDEKTGTCVICSKVTCLQCNVLKNDDNHECKEEDLLNWQEIKKNTKPCPNCNVRIHKISGCNQMWCPQCHVAFNYSTGHIEKGIIHNPHYYEYLNHNNINIQNQNVACHAGRLPEAWRVSNIKSHNKQDWLNFHRLLNHVHVVELNRFNNRIGALETRKKFLLNQIDEDTYKKRIQEIDKRDKKYNERRQILEMFYNIGRDILIDYVTGNGNKHVEMLNLITYVNESIEKLNHRYQSRLPIITNFSFY